MSEPEPDRRYQVLDHTADLGVELTAPTLEVGVAIAAQAMFDLMGQPSTASEQTEPVEVHGDGIDREDLLVGTLTELLAELELHGRYLVGVTEVEVTAPPEPSGLWRCRLRGQAVVIDRSQERSLIEIKAVTYHEIAVEPDEDDGWFVRVIFDL